MSFTGNLGHRRLRARFNLRLHGLITFGYDSLRVPYGTLQFFILHFRFFGVNKLSREKDMRTFAGRFSHSYSSQLLRLHPIPALIPTFDYVYKPIKTANRLHWNTYNQLGTSDSPFLASRTPFPTIPRQRSCISTPWTVPDRYFAHRLKKCIPFKRIYNNNKCPSYFAIVHDSLLEGRNRR
jgi:hypothetical protein